jgi:(2Fe-2S) ferredoxin
MITSSKIPYQKIVFVCTHSREGEVACGNHTRGENAGIPLVERLRQEVQKRGLKDKIRVAKSGCMDQCARGPNMMVFDAHGNSTWYQCITLSDLPEIIEKHF